MGIHYGTWHTRPVERGTASASPSNVGGNPASGQRTSAIDAEAQSSQTMSQEVVLFDLPSRGKPSCWSLNPWKTRAALNFKQMPYKTEWIEYPDVEPTFKSFGIPPNKPEVNSRLYSIPAVKLPDGQYVMDSRAIADKLEALQPTPSLNLDNGYTDRTQKLVAGAMGPLRPNALPLVPERILNASSAKYFHETRIEMFGMPLPELAVSDIAGENAWKAAAAPINDLKELLLENDGPYIAGHEASYADLILGGALVFLRRLDERALYERFLAYDPVFAKHVAATSRFFERANH